MESSGPYQDVPSIDDMFLDFNLTMPPDSDYEDYDSPVVNIYVGILSTIGIVGVAANICMIWSLYKTWITGSRFHFYLLALCLTDLLGLCIKCPMEISSYLSQWTGSYYGCKISMASDLFLIFLNHFILAGFNIDNVIALIGRRSYRVTRIVVILVCCALALVSSGIQISIAQLEYGYRGHVFCYVGSPGVVFIALFWLPACVIVLFGIPATIIACIRRSDNNSEKTSLVEDKHAETQDIIISRDVRLVTVYNAVFFICWAPTSIFYGFMYEYWSGIIAQLFFGTLCFCSSLLNPVAYKIFISIRNRRGDQAAGI